MRQSALLPDSAVLTEVVAVIALEDDERRVDELQPVEGIEEADDLRIDERDAGIVGLQRAAERGFVQAVVGHGVVVGEGGLP